MKKFPDLQKKYEAPTFQVISRVLKSLTGKKIIPPSSFRTYVAALVVMEESAYVQRSRHERYQGQCEGCSGRAVLFGKGHDLHRQTTHPHRFLKDGKHLVLSVSFSFPLLRCVTKLTCRVGGGVASAKTFDLKVVSKTEASDHVFSALGKEEMEPIGLFLKSKNVKIKNELDDVMEIDPISEDDEEDDISIPSDDEKPSKKDKKGTQPARRAADEEDESGKQIFEIVELR